MSSPRDKAEQVYEVKAPHAGAEGHTFLVSPVDPTPILAPILTAVPVMKAPDSPASMDKTKEMEELDDEQPSCSSQAVVPLSSSLPCKLLRMHARRSAQALLHQMESMDSQLGSSNGSTSEDTSPSAPPMSPTDHQLVDVGMGSSIGDSDESSEEGDELKPLAVDNHIIAEVDLTERQTTPPAVLSEANLEKFRKHQMDNIYLHPNFTLDASPPPAVAPANSPVLEAKRTHRSFLTMKKEKEVEPPQEKEQEVPVHQEQDTEPQGPNEIDTLVPSLIPSEELAAEITDAVEFYFSNESILKDAFLLKHVRRNKEGFVSLKLVSSFKRVRQLTREWKVVGDAVRRKSRKIELNDVGTKVRRIEPLPSFDETMPSRTIVACDLPLDKLTIEKVSDLFSPCGEIALIRILKPGMAIPVDVRQFMNKYPELQQKECALVEYLESSSARDARHLNGPFQVYEMVAPKKKTGKKAAVIQIAAPVARMVENYRYYNDANYERSRGGSFSGHETVPDLRFKLKRNNSDFQPSYYQQTGPSYHANPYQHYQPRGSIGNQNQEVGPNGFFGYGPRRYSNTSTISANTAAALGDVSPISSAVNSGGNPMVSGISSLQRRLSNCSEQNYTPEVNPSMSRRASNCSETGGVPQRRDSNCSESCPCSRRVSDFAQTTDTSYRKTSVCSNGSCPGNNQNQERRFSNGSMQFERTFSNASESSGFYRRPSNDFNIEREPIQTDQLVGGGGGGYQVWPRRYSNNFQQLSSKLAAYDNAQYIGGRRISTDSGYDRRCSFGSEGFEGSPRSRTGSFLSNYKHGGGDGYDGQPRSRTGSFLDGSPRSRSGSFAQRAAESLVRTPMGPDGSKGFGQRARKFGQTISPVN
uniref:LP19379p n=1 Tax=Drosophila melanogaster TaxID=7227 RepID=Q5BI76_DROME|nr:LP19379p [Drosophila melanogaster]